MPDRDQELPLLENLLDAEKQREIRLRADEIVGVINSQMEDCKANIRYLEKRIKELKEKQ